MGAEYLAPTYIRSPHSGELLYRLRYPGPYTTKMREAVLVLKLHGVQESIIQIS